MSSPTHLGRVADGDGLRAAFACFPSGVIAIGALVDGAPCGMAVSSFTSVSLDPPLVSVCVGRTSETWPLLAPAPEIGLSVLAEAHEHAVRDLSRKGADRFAQVSWESSPAGAVFIHGSSLWLSCRTEATVQAGDHDIVLLRVQALRSEPEIPPIVFHGRRLRRLIPCGAPTQASRDHSHVR